MVKKLLVLCGSFSSRIKKIQFLLFILILAGTGIAGGGAGLYAQSSGAEAGAGTASNSKFKQRIEWSADKNAFEYKVEIRSSGKIIKTFNTSDNFVNLNLPAGFYDYRVTVYDFLGRESDVSAWQKFEISKASEPVFNNVEPDVEVDVSAGKKIVLPVEVDHVAEGASVALVNLKTGEKIKGTLIMSGAGTTAAGAGAAGAVAATGKSEIKKASAEFPKISAGEWKLVVENPSGLTSESPSIAITTVDKEKERKAAEKAAEKAAKEAAELAEREERDRLAAEEADRKAAEKAEKERLAAELAEQEAREKAEREAAELAEKERQAEEKARLAEEKARLEAEEKERIAEEKARLAEEKERLATEEAERKKEEELARKEEAEKKKAARAARKVLGIEVKAGAAAALDLFDSDLLNLKNFDTLTMNHLPEIVTLSPLASISYVPNLNWRIRPGLEISASGFMYENRSASFGQDEWEYTQMFCYNNVSASLIGQINLIPKILIDVKAGGGITEILVRTDYVRDREQSVKAFMYPALNAGASFEIVPVKNLVFEIGADYNMILSSKIHFSYLKPYLEVGVRF